MADCCITDSPKLQSAEQGVPAAAIVALLPRSSQALTGTLVLTALSSRVYLALSYVDAADILRDRERGCDVPFTRLARGTRLVRGACC